MEISRDILENFMLENLDSLAKTGENSWRARCPLCGDSKKSQNKKRFNITYYNEDKILYNCFNCNCSGNFIQLYSILKGVTIQQALKLFSNKKWEKLSFDKKEEKFKLPIQKIKKENHNYILHDVVKSNPEGIIQKSLLNKLKEFKLSRKINYPLFIAYKGEFKNRIIIPIIEDKQIIYFQARALGKSDIKYKNPKSEKSSILLNREKWNLDKPIVICEGILDALSLENSNGTVCFGAKISDEFLSLFPEKANIIICLDNDATGKAEIKKIQSNSKFKHKLMYCIWPQNIKCKDLNELKCSNDNINIYDFVLSNSFNLLKSKVLMN